MPAKIRTATALAVFAAVGLASPALAADGPAPSLTVTNTTSFPAAMAGAKVLHAVTITNPTASPITITSLVDTLYGDITKAQMSTCSTTSINAGASYTCHFTATLKGRVGSTRTDVLHVGATLPDGSALSSAAAATQRVLTPTAHLTLRITGPQAQTITATVPLSKIKTRKGAHSTIQGLRLTTTTKHNGSPVTIHLSVSNGTSPTGTITITSATQPALTFTPQTFDTPTGAISGVAGRCTTTGLSTLRWNIDLALGA